jgi:transposase
MDQHDLTRLMDLDAALASPDGLHIETAATRHGVNPRTVKRLVALIRGTGRVTILEQSPRTGRLAIHRYAPGVSRLFLPPDMIAVPRGGRPETYDQAKRDQVVRLARDGVKYDAIVTQTSIPIATVKRWAWAAGIRRQPGPRKKSH